MRNYSHNKGNGPELYEPRPLLGARAPPRPGPFPAAVLVSGSGPQDRDSTIAGHRLFLVWADALTRRGIAVLRCDDRKIGFIGHSEGGLIAPMVAARNPDVAFLVLLAGTGVQGDRLAIMQTEAVFRSRGAGPEAIRKEARMYEKMFRVIETSQTAQAAEADLNRIIAETLAEMSDSEKKELNVGEDSLLTDLKGMLADFP